jgi:transposase
METKKPYQLYEEEFKKSIVTLYQNGKSQSQLSKEYGISTSAISKWIKQYSTVKTEDGDVLTAKQIKELQKRNAQLEEENLILKKAIAIFAPHSNND